VLPSAASISQSWGLSRRKFYGTQRSSNLWKEEVSHPLTQRVGAGSADPEVRGDGINSRYY